MINVEIHGGNRIASALKKIQDRLSAKQRVLVGLPAGAGNYEDGTPIVVIGAVQEFGGTIQHPGGRRQREAEEANRWFIQRGERRDGSYTIIIPERSFLRVPLRQNQDNINRAFRSLTGAVARGEISAFQMLDQIGARAAGYCQEAIEAGIQPANAESTVKAKGSATPLVNHGTLKGKITHVVED